MKINTDCIHPDDVEHLLAMSQESFCVETLSLNVCAYDNAEIHKGRGVAAVWVNQKAVKGTYEYIDTITPPPAELL